METEYDNEYYENLNKGFHKMFIDATTNIFLEDCINERYKEINNIKDTRWRQIMMKI